VGVVGLLAGRKSGYSLVVDTKRKLSKLIETVAKIGQKMHDRFEKGKIEGSKYRLDIGA
jgi:hypothetical protein